MFFVFGGGAGGGGGTPGGSTTQVQFNDGGAFGGSAFFTFNKTTGVLTLNPAGTGTTLTNPTLQATNSVNGFTQISIQNKSTGTSSSADLIAYPDNNTNDLTGFADIGITSSLYSDATYAVTGQNEGYFFVSAPSGASKSGKMVLATDSTGTHNGIAFATGGFNSLNNIRMNIRGSKAFVSIGQDVTPAARLHIASNESATAWTTGGIGLRVDAATYTDTTSSGTVAAMYVHAMNVPTIAATSVTTFTTSATLFVAAPAAGTNVTLSGIPFAIYAQGSIFSSSFIYASSGFFTSTSGGSASFGTAAGSSSSAFTSTSLDVEGATSVNTRVSINGTTSTVANVGANYAGLVIGAGAVTGAASGNHPLFASLIIRPPTVTNGAATVSNAATLYIETSPTVTVTGSSFALWVKAGTSLFGGGISTSTNGTQANFFSVGGVSSQSSSQAGFLVEGATNTTYRTSFYGDTTTTIGVGQNYIGTVFAASAVTEAASGNHPLISSAVFRAPVITGGAATVSNTATVYIEGAPTATVSGASYALWVKGGTAKFAATSGTHTADSDGATITFDMNVSNYHAVTLGGNRTLAVSNTKAGQAFTIILKQDGTGTRTVTWFSGILWSGGTVPTLTTTINKTDVFTFYYDGTNYYGGIVGQNY